MRFADGQRTTYSLAYAEIRLIMAKLLWHFDMRLAGESKHTSWMASQKTMLLWDKIPLWVNFERVASA